MPKLKLGTPIPTAVEDIAITAATMDDPDARTFTDEEWADVKPAHDHRRRIQTVPKTFISIHIDARILDEFKASGEGWQTRMNFALAEWAEQHGVLGHSPN